jgi:hypothetical protein
MIRSQLASYARILRSYFRDFDLRASRRRPFVAIQSHGVSSLLVLEQFEESLGDMFRA